MKSLLVLLLALALVVPAAAQDEGIFPYPAQTEVLDNGLKVIVIPMSSPGLLSYWTIVRTGSRDEYEPGRTGFAHFFEHMMFRGTERFPANVYNAKTTELGADTNAYTTDDLTAYHLAVAAVDLETVMDLESDRFQNLAYPKKSFETEAGAVYGEYRKNRSNPFFALSEGLQETAYDVHTYGHTTMGYEQDIKNMPNLYDYSLSFFDRYYRPDNIVLLISGDVEPQKVFDMAREYYGEWESGYEPPKVEQEPPQTAERKVEIDYPGRTLPIIQLAYKADAFTPENKRLAAADLLSDLAFGQTSDIYRQLVLEEQVVEFIFAGAPTNRDPGLIEIAARVKDPAKLEYVQQQIEATIARYQQNPPDAERLEQVKSRIKYGFLMNLDTPDAVNSSLARMVAITGGVEVIDELFGTMQAVTPQDVQEAAQHYLKPEQRTVAILRGSN